MKKTLEFSSFFFLISNFQTSFYKKRGPGDFDTGKNFPKRIKFETAVAKGGRVLL